LYSAAAWPSPHLEVVVPPRLCARDVPPLFDQERLELLELFLGENVAHGHVPVTRRVDELLHVGHQVVVVLVLGSDPVFEPATGEGLDQPNRG
jgi:hypothetical protein